MLYFEVGSRKSEVGSRKSEVGSPSSAFVGSVIDCWDYGDQATERESAEIREDVSEEAEASNEVVQVQPSDTTVRLNHTVWTNTATPWDQSLFLFYDGQSNVPAY